MTSRILYVMARILLALAEDHARVSMRLRPLLNELMKFIKENNERYTD